MMKMPEAPTQPKNKSLQSSKFVAPIVPYMKEEPNKNKLEERAPKIKYFNPDSVEY